MTSTANAEPKGSEPSSTECDHPDNDPCDRCMPGELHKHEFEYQTGGVYKCACGAVALMTEPGAEPPLTPEEEEQAPPDEEACDHQCRCGHDHWDHSSSGYCKQCDCESSSGHYVTDCFWAPEDENCPHIGSYIVNASDGSRPSVQLACPTCHAEWTHHEDDGPLPPQPGRRPPYAVAYSVQGHLYEVALPGDATVKAVDGSLIIQHHLGPVAGIVQVLPVINKESA